MIEWYFELIKSCGLFTGEPINHLLQQVIVFGSPEMNYSLQSIIHFLDRRYIR